MISTAKFKQRCSKYYACACQELSIEDEWTTTGGSRPIPFPVCDKITPAGKRVIVFATDTTLRQLASSDCWLMDGNFAMAPKIFKQLYVIRTPLADSAVTCAYALLGGKSQLVYETMFNGINDKCQELGFDVAPTQVVTDF